MNTKRIPAAAIGLMLLAVTGCGSGPALYPVSGTITLNGEPLANAAVMFLPLGPDGSLTAEAMTGPDGKYTLATRGDAGVAAGKYKVSVAKAAPPPSDVNPAFADDPYMASLGAGVNTAKKKKSSKESAVDDTFEVEVVAGKNSPFDHDVKVGVEAAKP